MSNAAVFFDRDGTLMEEVGYASSPSQVRVYSGVSGALGRLKQAGFRIVLITNQSGIGRGYFTDAEYRAVNAEFLRQLGSELIDASYYCPDLPSAPTPCRKPSPGMVLEAASDLNLDLTRSWFIGDKEIDVECGRRAGTRTIQVLTGYGASQPAEEADFRAKDIPEAVRIVLGS
jgi:D-glycero-D-manno-heptose 1,7-bisphosphate phosphatase